MGRARAPFERDSVLGSEVLASSHRLLPLLGLQSGGLMRRCLLEVCSIDKPKTATLAARHYFID